jgi:hypothetical protein
MGLKEFISNLIRGNQNKQRLVQNLGRYEGEYPEERELRGYEREDYKANLRAAVMKERLKRNMFNGSKNSLIAGNNARSEFKKVLQEGNYTPEEKLLYSNEPIKETRQGRNIKLNSNDKKIKQYLRLLKLQKRLKKSKTSKLNLAQRFQRAAISGKNPRLEALKFRLIKPVQEPNILNQQDIFFNPQPSAYSYSQIPLRKKQENEGIFLGRGLI